MVDHFLAHISVSQSSIHLSRLGGVVVSVLATGPEVRRFEPGRGDGFLRAIKIRTTLSFGWEVKPEDPPITPIIYIALPSRR
jgi:hypothetical protein